VSDYLTIFNTEVLPRLLGLAAGLFVTWAAQHGLTLDVKEITALFVAVYAVVHSLITAPKKVRAIRAQRMLQRTLSAEPALTRDYSRHD
jgi:hypothetical protein